MVEFKTVVKWSSSEWFWTKCPPFRRTIYVTPLPLLQYSPIVEFCKLALGVFQIYANPSIFKVKECLFSTGTLCLSI